MFVSTKEKHGTVRVVTGVVTQMGCTDFTSPPAWRSGYSTHDSQSVEHYMKSGGSSPVGAGETIYIFF